MYALAFLLIGLFRKFIEKSGADYRQVRTIVKYKIIMDNRKSLSPTDQKKERNYAFILQLLFYFIFGVMFGVVIGTNPSLPTSLFVTFSFLMMLSAINMIADFSTLLLDTRDNTIIIPRPVAERTFLLARIFHISSYILSITLAFSIVPVIAIIVKFTVLAAFVFLIEVMMCTLFSIFITHIFYLSLMKYTSGERFKDIIAYFQTIMTILFMGGYQLLPKYLKHIEIKTIDDWTMLLAPPTWMAQTTSAFVGFHFNVFSISSILLGLIIPLAGIWLVIRVLAPGYLKKLVVLEQGDRKHVSTKIVSSKNGIQGKLAYLFTRTSIENAAFQTIWRLTSREREYKQTIFAMIGSVVIIVFVIIFKDSSNVETLKYSNKYLYLIYAPFFFLFGIVTNLRISNNFKSAWVYTVAPIEKPGEIISGAYKAVIIKVFVPLFMLCNAITIYIWGASYIGQIFEGLLFNILSIVTLILLFKSNLPFSVERKEARNWSNILSGFIMFLVAYGMGALHNLMVHFKVNEIIMILIAMLGCGIAFKVLRNRSWKMMVKVV